MPLPPLQRRRRRLIAAAFASFVTPRCKLPGRVDVIHRRLCSDHSENFSSSVATARGFETTSNLKRKPDTLSVSRIKFKGELTPELIPAFWVLNLRYWKGAHQSKQTNKHWWSRQREQRHRPAFLAGLKCFLDYSAFKGSPAVDLKRQFIPELQRQSSSMHGSKAFVKPARRESSKGFRGPATSNLARPTWSETASSLAPSTTLFSSLHCIATLESKNGRQRPKTFRVTHS